MCDVTVQSGLQRVKSNLASRVKKGKMTQEAADAVMQRVKGTLDYSDFKSVDMVRPAALQSLPPAPCMTRQCMLLPMFQSPYALCSAM